MIDDRFLLFGALLCGAIMESAFVAMKEKAGQICGAILILLIFLCAWEGNCFSLMSSYIDRPSYQLIE
jgi:hypothetical protein